MVIIKKSILFICVIMMVIGFGIGCSSSEKPSEEVIKIVIMEIEFGNVRDDIKFDTFKITNGFFSKENGSKSDHYNIEVNYKITYIDQELMVKITNKITNAQQDINYLTNELKNPSLSTETQNNYKSMINDYNNKIEKYRQEKVYNQIVRDNVKLFFEKRGDKWYGYPQWK
jgi:hypothetical protein